MFFFWYVETYSFFTLQSVFQIFLLAIIIRYISDSVKEQAICPSIKDCNPWHIGTHLKVLSESFPMNTSMTRFWWFSKMFVSLSSDKRSLSIGRLKDSSKDQHWLSTTSAGIQISEVHYNFLPDERLPRMFHTPWITMVAADGGSLLLFKRASTYSALIAFTSGPLSLKVRPD